MLGLPESNGYPSSCIFEEYVDMLVAVASLLLVSQTNGMTDFMNDACRRARVPDKNSLLASEHSYP